MGSKEVSGLKYREGWAFLGQKGTKGGMSLEKKGANVSLDV